jgi:hypothetical protein
MNSGLQDASHLLARPRIPGGTPEQRRARIEALIEARMLAFREKLDRVRIATEPFEGYRPLSASLPDLGDVAFTMQAGREVSSAGAIAARYPQFLRPLTDAEIRERMAEARSALRWQLLHE